MIFLGSWGPFWWWGPVAGAKSATGVNPALATQGRRIRVDGVTGPPPTFGEGGTYYILSPPQLLTKLET